MDLAELIKDNLAERARVEASIEAMTSRLADLESELQGLMLAAARHGLDVTPVLEAEPVTEMDRTDAIIAVMTDAARPMSPMEIVEHLAATGRNDEYNAVSAALAYLKRRARVHSVGRGQWQVGPAPTDELLFARDESPED